MNGSIVLKYKHLLEYAFLFIHFCTFIDWHGVILTLSEKEIVSTFLCLRRHTWKPNKNFQTLVWISTILKYVHFPETNMMSFVSLWLNVSLTTQTKGIYTNLLRYTHPLKGHKAKCQAAHPSQSGYSHVLEIIRWIVYFWFCEWAILCLRCSDS